MKADDSTVDEMWNYFKSTVQEGMEKFIPRSRGYRSTSGKKIFPCSKLMQTLIRKKHRLWNRYIETRKDNIRVEYNKVRNMVKSESRKLIVTEQEAIAATCKNNPKKFWKYVNGKTRNNTVVSKLKWNDKQGNAKIAESDEDKANALEFFSSVYTVEKDGDCAALPDRNIKDSMQEFTININAILEKLSNLKVDKSPGMDLLHPRVLYETRQEIAEALLVIFNKSLATGSVPSDWKKAEVIALHKKGSRSDRGNYRPVSLTSICCKLLESLVRDHIMRFILSNELLSKNSMALLKEGRLCYNYFICSTSGLDIWKMEVRLMQFTPTSRKHLIKCPIRG